MAEQTSSKEDAYEDRNLLALLVAVLADGEGHNAGFEPIPEDPEWPVLFIDLGDAGQISYHIPVALSREFPLFQGYHARKWDGHTTEEKRRRIKQYIHDQLEDWYGND